MSVQKNLAKIKNTLADACLVAVTKYASEAEIIELIAAGHRVFGESKIQVAREKFDKYKEYNIQWHLIGHLQSNKAKYAVKIFELIQSVDSLKLAQALDLEAAKINKIQKILLQINIGAEEQKFGFAAGEIMAFLPEIIKLKNIEVCGLMAMAPYFEDAEKTRPYFQEMKRLFDKIKNEYPAIMKYLSLGMSHDYQIALAAGANMVRIGSALFEMETNETQLA